MTPTREQTEAARTTVERILKVSTSGPVFLSYADVFALRDLLAATVMPDEVSPDVAEARAKLRRLAQASCFSREVAETIEVALGDGAAPLTDEVLVDEFVNQEDAQDIRAAAERLAEALDVDRYRGKLEGPGAGEVVRAHRALCAALYGNNAPPASPTKQELAQEAWFAHVAHSNADARSFALGYNSGVRREGRRADAAERYKEMVRALGDRCDVCKQIGSHANVCPIGGALGGV
jgi:hypothetical protein